MDLSRPVLYRGLDINDLEALSPGEPLVGYRLQEVRFPEVNGWGYSEKRSLADGYDYSRVFLGERKFSLRGTVYADTQAGLHDRVRTLRALFTPTLAYAADPANKGFLPLDFDWPTEDTANWPTGYIPVRLYARPEDQPGAYFSRDAAFGRDGEGYSNVFEVAMCAKDPRFYAQTASEVATTATSGSGTTTNKGDYPSPLQVTLTLLAASTGQRVYTLTGFGTVMHVTVPAAAADRSVIVDANLKVVSLVQNNAEVLRMDLIEFEAGMTWPVVQPGANEYDWAISGGGLASGSKFSYRQAFV